MIKKKICIYVSILLCLVCIIGIEPIRKSVVDVLRNFIVEQLDKEELERRQRSEKGEIVQGKDTVMTWGNIFEIGRFVDSDYLLISNDDHTVDTVIKEVVSYKIEDEKLYIVSLEGYAVINKENLCRVYITVSSESFNSGYSLDSNGNKHYISRYLDNEHIEYLVDFTEYSLEEQKTLNEILVHN